ncbi:MAG: DNA-binding response regulator [Chloroflexi bacterium]|nr:MAG: hypothetical protein CUN54_06000 [Phototrophicales bacterium]RMF81473.1 MAG: DNA-binding response regulator [Chloroflexota bacterium]
MATSRIITVDPSGAIGRIVGATVELTNRNDVRHIHVPGGQDALEELSRGGCQLLVTAISLSDHIKGFELAIRIRQESPDTQVIILADVDDPEMQDEDMLANSPFVYMHRPIDPQQFIRVVTAGLDGQDIREALASVSIGNGGGGNGADFAPIPEIDPAAATPLIDQLLTDVAAQAIILANRAGEVLLERGASGLNREEVSSALMPVAKTTIDMRSLVGGDTSTVQFYDGDEFDVYVLSIGLHHFLCLIFDGQSGARQFGVVNSFGRRTAQDLIALLGASAFILQQPIRIPEEIEQTATYSDSEEPDSLEPVIKRERASRPVEEEALKLDPISEEDFDPNLFDDIADVALDEADALFDLDALSEFAQDTPSKQGALSLEDARRLGIIDD